MILQEQALKRVKFDPTNQEHRVAYKVFLKTGRWTMHFMCEQTFPSIVSTIERKLVIHALKDVEAIAEPTVKEINADRERRKCDTIAIGADTLTTLSPK